MTAPVQIPLRSRDGSIRAYALVDAADADWVNQWRWSIVGSGYASRQRSLREGPRRLLYLHCELLGLRDWDGLEGDHIDRDRLNCQRSNLRVVTRAQNRQNIPSYARSTSKYRGVNFDSARGKWKARISVGGIDIMIGRFTDELEAAKAAQRARLQMMTHAVEEVIL